MENIRENYKIVTQNITEQEGRGRLYQIPSVDNALTNILTLPQVIKDVSQIHKGQTLEIKKQQNLLDTIQQQLKLVEQQEKKHLEAIASVTRKLHISEEETQRKKEMCNQYEKEIADLMKECESQTSVIFHLKKTIKEEQWEHDKCKEKVLRYKDDKNVKITSEDDLRLKEVKHQVEALRLKWQSIQQSEEKETIFNGVTEYEALKIQEKENEEKIQTAKEKVENLKAEIKQTEQSTYVLHKRNKAQMTRFKRELKELTNQSSYSKERLNYLQQQISNLRQQIFMFK